MSDAAVIALIGALSGVFTAFVTGYFGYKIKKTADTTLKHVNHAAIAQQKVIAISARMIATLLKNDPLQGPIFENNAQKAEAELLAMEQSQAQIDKNT